VDKATEKSSEPFSYIVIKTSTQIDPKVTVSPSSGKQGVTFNEPGTYFTPNSKVTLHFKYPDGTESIVSKTTDKNGAYNNSWATDKKTQTGVYQYWAVDITSSKISNVVSFTLY
jgi:hypothetical protein